MLSVALAACGSGSSSGGASTAPSTSTAVSTASSAAPAAKGKVVIGTFDFSESKILANLYSLALIKAGYTTEVKTVGAREITEPALEKGSSDGGVDVVPEYLATFTEFLNTKKNGKGAAAVASGDVDETLTAGQALAQGYGISLLTPSAATDQNAFAVTKKFADATTTSRRCRDLAGYKGDLILGGPSECPKRPFCQPGLEKTYGLTFTSFKPLDAGGPLTKRPSRRARSRSVWSSPATAASPHWACRCSRTTSTSRTPTTSSPRSTASRPVTPTSRRRSTPSPRR